MNREITVLLKHPDAVEETPTKKFWKVVNEVVRSPLFVFIFGASIMPIINYISTPASEIEAIKVREEARTDAALIAPFLANLNINEPGKFQASQAALRELERLSKTSENGNKSPMFAAVNKAVEAVSKGIWPAPPKTNLTVAVVQQIDNLAAQPDALPKSTVTSYSLLQSASVVYIQVNKDSPAQQETAQKVLKTLQANSVLAPGIEKLARNTMPKNTQIRYFNDTDRAKADDLAAIVSQETNLKVYVVKPNIKAKEGVLEIWLGKD